MLPLVASITVCPGLSLPDRSASSITPRAKRSFTEPKGLNASIFTKRFTSGGASLPILTIGVSPTVPRILSNLRPTFMNPPIWSTGKRRRTPTQMRRPLSSRSGARVSDRLRKGYELLVWQLQGAVKLRIIDCSSEDRDEALRDAQ